MHAMNETRPIYAAAACRMHMGRCGPAGTACLREADREGHFPRLSVLAPGSRACRSRACRSRACRFPRLSRRACGFPRLSFRP